MLYSIKGLVLWVDATREGVLTNTNNSSNPEDGDYIKSWKEFNPIQQEQLSFISSTAGTYPVYKETGNNGLPAISFDGVDDSLAIDSNDRLNILNDITIFFVYSVARNSNSLTSTQGMMAKQAGLDIYSNNMTVTNPPYGINLDYGSYAVFIMSSPTSNYSAVSKPTTLMPAVNIVTAINDSNSGYSYIYMNGGTPASYSSSIGRLGAVRSALKLGQQKDTATTRFSTCYISEILIYNRVLNSEERVSIIKYLGKKWGISVT